MWGERERARMEDPKKLEEGFRDGNENEEEGKNILPDTAGEQLVAKQKSKRVATLDAFRGLTIVVT